MLDFIDRRADLNKLYQYKLKKLFNSRTSPVDVADLVFLIVIVSNNKLYV